MPITEPLHLSPSQARVLGVLIEKEATTPDYYPLSLNALMNACNQLSNREPVMRLDEEEVRLALRRLEEQSLAGRARSADGRVAKFEHWLGEAFNFTRAEIALICILLLRGPQTPGELRSRTDRIHSFDEISEVLAGLQKLMDRTPTLAAVLPRQPGTKESRYAHLLSGPVESIPTPAYAAPAYQDAPRREPNHLASSSAPIDEAQHDRIAHLEATVAQLKDEVAKLSQKIDDLFGD